MEKHQFVTSAFATAVSLFLPLAVLLPPSNAAETTLGVCMTKSNTVQVYDVNGQLKMRLFDRIRNVTWLNAPASKSKTASFVEFRNLQGETRVVTSFSRVAMTCAVNIGGKSEPGQVTTGNPGGVSPQAATPAEVERTCLNKAQQSGYRVYKQTSAQQAASFYFMDLEGTAANGNRYAMRCRYNTASRTATLEDIRLVASNDNNIKIKAEATCLAKAQRSGYQVFSQTAAEKAGSFYFVELKATSRNGLQYSMTCRFNTASQTANLENIRPITAPPVPQSR
ncbi:MAG: hypothetical protein ACKO24_14190 [Leptolyngbyaceae cyanobacterium]